MPGHSGIEKEKTDNRCHWWNHPPDENASRDKVWSSVRKTGKINESKRIYGSVSDMRGSEVFEKREMDSHQVNALLCMKQYLSK